MPLSENEQRILRQIEEQLQRDPSFSRGAIARSMGSRRGLVLSTAAAVLALGLAILLLAVSPYLAFAAFVLAIVAALFAERHARALGSGALGNIPRPLRRSGVSGPQQQPPSRDRD
jgi:hypothetical protein